MPWTVRSRALQGMHTDGLPWQRVEGSLVCPHGYVGSWAVAHLPISAETQRLFFSSCTYLGNDREPYHIV